MVVDRSGTHLHFSPQVVGEHPDPGHHAVGDDALGGDDIEGSVLLRFTEELLLRSSSVVCQEHFGGGRGRVGGDDLVLERMVDRLEEVEL